MPNKFKNTNHSYLRYANCWEDADILLEGLDIQTTDKVISIASAGDNTFSILSKSPQKVITLDINKVQLFLTELKKACFIKLNHTEFLELLGFNDSVNRLNLFEKVKSELSMQAIRHWEANFEQIENGIINQGKFEKYFRLFRTKIVPLIHSEKIINDLLAHKSNEEQLNFYNKKWNTWRWKLLFNIFFSKAVMAKFGRDKSLFNEVDISVKKFIFSQVEKEISNEKCQTNYFLNYILRGGFYTGLPHYARVENFEKIKNNCKKLEIKYGLLEDVLKSEGKFDKFNLSNIFEYISVTEFKKMSNILKANSNPKALFLNWSLMVKRQLNQVNNEFITINSTELKKVDLCFFYNELNIHKLK